MPNENTTFTPVQDQYTNSLPPGISTAYYGSDGNDYYEIEEIKASANKEGSTWDNVKSWFSDNLGWLAPVAGVGISAATGTWIPALLSGLFSIGNTWLQNKYNKEQYERELDAQKDAENRANEEYDRRVEDQRAYDENWDQRLLAKGYNPLSVLSKGQGTTSSAFSSPSTSAMPRGIPRQAPMAGIGNAMSIAQAIASLKQAEATTKNIEANTRNTDADTEQKNQLINTFWDRFSKEMENLSSSIKNRDSQTRLNTLSAQFKEATMSYDFAKAQYTTQQAYYEMERSGISVDQARADLQYRLNAIAQQALQSQLMDQQIDVNSVTLDQLVTTWNANKHLVDEQAQAQLSLLNERVRSATKANNWYAVNQVIGGLSSIGSTVSSLVNAFKPFPQITSTYTERSTIGEFGNVIGTTTEFRENTYSK